MYTSGLPSPALPGTRIHAFLQAQGNDSHWPTTAGIRIVLPLVDICLQMNRRRLWLWSEIAESQLRRATLGPRTCLLYSQPFGFKVLYSSDLARLV
jgi:hypothetical protein